MPGANALPLTYNFSTISNVKVSMDPNIPGAAGMQLVPSWNAKTLHGTATFGGLVGPGGIWAYNMGNMTNNPMSYVGGGAEWPILGPLRSFEGTVSGKIELRE